MSIRLIGGDCREVLATLPADSVHCVVMLRGSPARSSVACSTSANEAGAIARPSLRLLREACVERRREAFCGLGNWRRGRAQWPGSVMLRASSGSDGATCALSGAPPSPWLYACDSAGIGSGRSRDRYLPVCRATGRSLQEVLALQSRRIGVSDSPSLRRVIGRPSDIQGCLRHPLGQQDTRPGMGRGQP